MPRLRAVKENCMHQTKSDYAPMSHYLKTPVNSEKICEVCKSVVKPESIFLWFRAGLYRWKSIDFDIICSDYYWSKNISTPLAITRQLMVRSEFYFSVFQIQFTAAIIHGSSPHFHYTLIFSCVIHTKYRVLPHEFSGKKWYPRKRQLHDKFCILTRFSRP